MECNIDAKGRLARLVWGLVLVLVGLVLIGLAFAQVVTGWWPWAVASALLAGGGFGIYEGWCGWCVIRAMGFKTPM